MYTGPVSVPSGIFILNHDGKYFLSTYIKERKYETETNRNLHNKK